MLAAPVKYTIRYVALNIVAAGLIVLLVATEAEILFVFVELLTIASGPASLIAWNFMLPNLVSDMYIICPVLVSILLVALLGYPRLEWRMICSLLFAILYAGSGVFAYALYITGH